MKTLLFNIIVFLFLMNNSYSQWVQTLGPEGGFVYDFFVNDTSLYAACAGSGFYRSTDQGENWTSLNSGFLYNGILTVAVKDNIVFAGAIDGLYKSTNNGINWARVNGFPDNSVEKLAVYGNFIFASIGGILKSTDNGLTWVNSGNGIPPYVGTYCFAFKDSLVFAGTDSGVYVSTNYGEYWYAVNNGLLNIFINDIVVKGNDLFAATAGGGVFRSTNNGQLWIYAGYGLIYPNVLCLNVMNNNLYAGIFGGGVMVTTNNGSSWQPVSEGLPGFPVVYSLNSHAGKIYAGNLYDGLFTSANNGQNWFSSNSGLIATSVISFAHCSRGILASADRRVFVSSDNGNTWENSSTGLSCTYAGPLEATVSGIFAGTRGGCGMYLSIDNGLSWQEKNNGLPLYLQVSSISSGGSFVFIGSALGIYRTSNGGEIWVPVNNDLNNLYISAIKFKGNIIFAANEDGIYRSTNYGVNWIFSSSGIPLYTLVECFAVDSNAIFAGTTGGVYYSSNNGLSWLSRSNGLADRFIQSLYRYNNFLITSTLLNGIYFSTNDGLNWQSMNQGFDVKSSCVSLIVTGGNLLAGTRGKGVFKFPANLINVKNTTSQVPTSFKLYQNYPNPFNPATKIKFDIPTPITPHSPLEGGQRGVTARLSIYDILGCEVAMLVDENLKPGSYEATWDASAFPSGIYFYKLISDSYIATKKMVLIK